MTGELAHHTEWHSRYREIITALEAEHGAWHSGRYLCVERSTRIRPTAQFVSNWASPEEVVANYSRTDRAGWEIECLIDLETQQRLAPVLALTFQPVPNPDPPVLAYKVLHDHDTKWVLIRCSDYGWPDLESDPPAALTHAEELCEAWSPLWPDVHIVAVTDPADLPHGVIT